MNFINEDQLHGAKIIMRSIQEPLKQIVKNVGHSSDIILKNVRENIEKYYGFDASNNVYGDMFSIGIVDPTKVTKSALRNAVSAACSLIISMGAIVEK